MKKKSGREKGRKNKINLKYVFIGASVALACWFLVFVYTGSREKRECDKWMYYKSTQTSVDSVENAIAVFTPFLKTEKKYKDHWYPQTADDFTAKYNIVPFERSQLVKDREGRWITVTGFDMLLAYFIDHDGNIYKYNMCGVI